MDTLIPGFIGLTLFGLMTAYLARQIWLARSSRSWPTVDGTVTWSRIRAWRTEKSGMHYAPEIRYEYTVQGERRVGTVVCFGRQWNRNRHSARRTAAEYPVGSPVQVHHHPEKPELATLETRAARRVYQFAVMTATMCVAILSAMLSA